MSHFAMLQKGDMKTKGDLGTEGESVGFPSSTVGIVSLGEKMVAPRCLFNTFQFVMGQKFLKWRRGEQKFGSINL